MALQPDWRIDDKNKDSTTMARTAPDNGWDNSKLLRSGPVGFHLIIMALGWWGKVINLKDQDEPDTGKFLEAVEDVQWVLDQILKSFASQDSETTKKRSAEIDDQSDSKKRWVFLMVFINNDSWFLFADLVVHFKQYI